MAAKLQDNATRQAEPPVGAANGREAQRRPPGRKIMPEVKQNTP